MSTDEKTLAGRRREQHRAAPRDVLIRAILGTLSGDSDGARLTTLIFHRVHAAADTLFPLEPDAVDFERRMRWVADWFDVLPAAEAVARLRAGTLPRRALCITFDDGYADNVHVALPILERLGLDATFFIATGYLDGGRMWNDRVIEAVRGSEGDALDLSSLGLGVHATTTPAQRRAAIDALIGQVRYREQAERDELASAIAAIARCDAPTDLMMTSDDIRTLAAAGMGIGAHTHRHPILSRLGVDAAEREIVESREVLEQLIGEAVPLFAYPNGRPGIDYGAEHVSIVERCGFDGAFSTSWGVADRSSDAFQLPRFLPWDRGRYAFAARLARNMTLAEPRAA